MITIRELGEHFHYLPQDQVDILLEIHNLVSLAAPGAVEDIRRYGVVYYDQERGGPVSAGICQSLLRGRQVHLAFNHGAYLPDPGGLLQGNRLVKRWIIIENYDHAPWEEIARLIEASARFDPYTLKP
jgi:hypothetical protein